MLKNHDVFLKGDVEDFRETFQENGTGNDVEVKSLGTEEKYPEKNVQVTFLTVSEKVVVNDEHTVRNAATDYAENEFDEKNFEVQVTETDLETREFAIDLEKRDIVENFVDNESVEKHKGLDKFALVSVSEVSSIQVKITQYDKGTVQETGDKNFCDD